MGGRATSPERVELIDSLRGAAALAVVVYHYVGLVPLVGGPVGPVGSAAVAAAGYGHLGVPVFFVLSGFVIAMTAARQPLTPAVGGRFVLRRLVRIAPPYWAMILITAAAVSAGRAVGYLRNTFVTPAQVAVHLAYAQDLLNVPPLDVAFWTLCLEVQFYLVFAASAVSLRRRSSAARAGWFAVLTAGSLALDALDAVPQAWFPRLWHQFGVGVLTYYAGQNRTARFALAVLLPAAVVTAAGREGSAAAVAVAAVLLLLRHREWAAGLGRLGLLLALGRISYSLYLVHGLVGMGLAAWFRAGSRSEAAGWAAITAATAAAVAAAAAFYALCERPAVWWSHRLRVGPGRDSPPAVPADEPPPVAPGGPVR